MHVLDGYDWFTVACLEAKYHDMELRHKETDIKKTISPDQVLYKFDNGVLFNENGSLQYLPRSNVNLLTKSEYYKYLFKKLRHKFHKRRLKEKMTLDKSDILYEGGDGFLIEFNKQYCYISKSDVNLRN